MRLQRQYARSRSALMASAFGAGGIGGKTMIWDRKTGKLLRSLDGKNSIVLGVAFSRDGERVVTSLGPQLLGTNAREARVPPAGRGDLEC